MVTQAQADSLNSWYDQGHALGETLRQESTNRTADVGLDAAPGELRARGIGEYDAAGDSRYQEWVASRPDVAGDDTYAGEVLDYAQGLDGEEEDYLTSRERVLNRPQVTSGLTPGEAGARFGAQGAAVSGLVDPNAPAPAATGARRIITPAAPVTDVDEFDPGVAAELATNQARTENAQQVARLGQNAAEAMRGGEFQRLTGQRLSGNAEIDNAVLQETIERQEQVARLGQNAAEAMRGGEFQRLTGQRLSGNAEIDNAVLAEALNRPEYHPNSATAPLAAIEADANPDRGDWPTDENGQRTLATLPDVVFLDGKRVTKAELLHSARQGAQAGISISTAFSGIPGATNERADSAITNQLIAAQEAGRLTTSIPAVPAVPTAVPHPVSGPAASGLSTAIQAAGSFGGGMTPTDYTTNPEGRRDFSKDLTEALVPGAGLVTAAAAANNPNSPGGALRTPAEQKGINLQAGLAALDVTPLPLRGAASVFKSSVRTLTPAQIGRLQALGGFVPSATPAGAVPRITGTSQEVLDASLRLRQDLLTKGSGQVVIGGKAVSIVEDRVSEAIRSANPQVEGLAFHATPVADVVSPGGTVPAVAGGGTYVAPGVSVTKFADRSAFGATGDSPGVIATALGPEQLQVPGPTPGTTNLYRGGRELEYVVATGDDLPATTPRVRVGGQLQESLYLPEELATPSYLQRTQANIGAVTDTLTGQQRGRLRADGIEHLSDDSLARGIYGDEAVNAGLTGRQQKYVQLSRLDDTTLNTRAADDPIAADVAAARREGQELVDEGARGVRRERVVGADGSAYVYNRAGILVPERVDLPRSELSPEQYTGRLEDPAAERADARGESGEAPGTARAASVDEAGASRTDGIFDVTDAGRAVKAAPETEAVRGTAFEPPEATASRATAEGGVPETTVTVRGEGEEQPPPRIIIPPPPPGTGRIVTRGAPEPAERGKTDAPPPEQRIATSTPPETARITGETPPPETARVVVETPPPTARITTDDPPPGRRIIIPPPETTRITTDTPPPPERRIITDDPPPPVRTTTTKRPPDPTLQESEPSEQQQTAEDGAHPHVAVIHEANVVDLRTGQVREEPLLDTLQVVQRGPAGTHGADVDAGSVRLLSRDGEVHAVPDVEGGPGHAGVEEAFSDASGADTAQVIGAETAAAPAPRLTLAERVRQANARVRDSAASGLAYGAGQLGDFEAGKAAARAEQEAKRKAQEEAAKQKVADKAAHAAQPLSERVRLASERVKDKDKTTTNQASTGGDSDSGGGTGQPGRKKSLAEQLGRALAGGQGAQGGAGAKRTGSKGKSASGKKKGRPAKYSDDKRIVVVLQYAPPPAKGAAKTTRQAPQAQGYFGGRG